MLVWLLLAVLLGTLLYLNRVGLPDFLEGPLQAGLREHGADLQFGRLRWRWYRGVVAEVVTLASADQPTGPRVQFDEVALDLDWGALLKERRLQVRSLEIRGGRLILPLNESNQPPENLYLEDVAARLRFLPDDRWELDQFRAMFFSSTLQISGSITHAAALREWQQNLTPGGAPTTPPFWRPHLREFVRVCRQMRFVSPPDLRLRFYGDAQDATSFTLEFSCHAAGAQTPWADLRELRLAARLNQPPPHDGWFHSSVDLAVQQAQTPWGEFRQAQLKAEVAQPATNLVPARVDWTLAVQAARARAARCQTAQIRAQSRRVSDNPFEWRTELAASLHQLTTDWGQAGSNQLSGWVTHCLTNAQPTEADLHGQFAPLQTRWGSADELDTDFHFGLDVGGRALARADWAWWTNLAPYRLEGQAAARNVRSPKLNADAVSLTGQWRAPELLLNHLDARLYGGTLHASNLALNADTRVVQAGLAFDFDAHSLAPLLGPGVEAWLAQFGWAQPPSAAANVRAVLPAWTNAAVNWPRQVLPNCVVNGHLRGTHATYRGVPVSSAQLSVALSNEVLRLADFKVTRPEGEAELAYELHTGTGDFRWQVRSALDAGTVGPAIDSQAPRLLRLFEFTCPTPVTGEVWGCWAPPKRVNCALAIAATNFTFRGEHLERLAGLLRIENRFLIATDVSLQTAGEWVEAPGVGFDLAVPQLFLTNLHCRIDPLRVARVIGSDVVHTLSPYRFAAPPDGCINGRMSLQEGVPDPDLTFDLVGGPFHYWRFNLPAVASSVHWRTHQVIITNVTASFYQGRLSGDMVVGLAERDAAKLRFHVQATNANLHLFLTDVLARTNRIVGAANASLDITEARADQWPTWTGVGRVEMRDGLLWDLPIFGIFSPILNAIVPGLANNRATAAKGLFTIRDGLIRTDNLAVDAGLARLRYVGTTDYAGKVNARVEAEILQEMPLLGPIISLVLTPLSKVLVYKVTGTLGNPQLDPLYVPRFLLPILRPIHTLRSLIPGESAPPPPPPAKQ